VLKSDFLDFPRYSGYSIQVKWANVQANDAKFPQDLTYQKSLKSVNFWQSYLKNKRGTFFGTQCSMGPGLQLVGARFFNFLLGRLSRELKLRRLSIFHKIQMAIFP